MRSAPSPDRVLHDLLVRLTALHSTFDRVTISCDRTRWRVTDGDDDRQESSQERLERAALYDAIVRFLTDIFDPAGFSMSFRLDTCRSHEYENEDEDDDPEPVSWRKEPTLIHGNPGILLSPAVFLRRLDLLRPLAPAAPEAGGDMIFEGSVGRPPLLTGTAYVQARDAAHAVHCMQFDSMVDSLLRRQAVMPPDSHAARDVKRIEKTSIVRDASQDSLKRLAAALENN